MLKDIDLMQNSVQHVDFIDHYVQVIVVKQTHVYKDMIIFVFG